MGFGVKMAADERQAASQPKVAEGGLGALRLAPSPTKWHPSGLPDPQIRPASPSPSSLPRPHTKPTYAYSIRVYVGGCVFAAVWAVVGEGAYTLAHACGWLRESICRTLARERELKLNG